MQIQAGSAPTDAKEPLESEEERSLVKTPGNTLAVIKAAIIDVTGSEAEKRALVLQNTDNWVEQLLDEWTLLDVEQEMDEPGDEAGSYERGSRYDSTPVAKTGGKDDTAGEPQSPLSSRASTRYATSGGEKLSLHSGRRRSLPNPSVEQGGRGHESQRGPKNHTGHTESKKEDFPEQLGDPNHGFQTATFATDESLSPEPQWTPKYKSRPPPKSSNSDSSEKRLPSDLVCFYNGGTNKKSKDGSPFELALKHRSESKEHYQIDKLRTTLNDICRGVKPPLDHFEYKALEDQILREVILKADSLPIYEPEA